MNKNKFFDSIKRGFAFSGMSAFASAGYSKSVVDAFEKMDEIK